MLADAGYGVDTAFRQRLSELGLDYVVGITSAVVVGPPGVEPLPPEPYGGRGRPRAAARDGAAQAGEGQGLACALPEAAFQTVCWREGSNDMLRGRFAAVRVRHAGGDRGRARLHAEQWLLIEWPAGDAEPLKYFLSTLPSDVPLTELVATAEEVRAT